MWSRKIVTITSLKAWAETNGSENITKKKKNVIAIRMKESDQTRYFQLSYAGESFKPLRDKLTKPSRDSISRTFAELDLESMLR